MFGIDWCIKKVSKYEVLNAYVSCMSGLLLYRKYMAGINIHALFCLGIKHTTLNRNLSGRDIHRVRQDFFIRRFSVLKFGETLYKFAYKEFHGT
jgi:hypothetical protein